MGLEAQNVISNLLQNCSYDMTREAREFIVSQEKTIYFLQRLCDKRLVELETLRKEKKSAC